MPVPKITADQFSKQLNDSINNRNSSYDTGIGPIPDIIVNPIAAILETQNDRIREVSQLILLDKQENFNDADVEAFVKNEFLTRNIGGKSSAVVTFSRSTTPTVNITIQKNFPIATEPNEATGETVVFVTTESKTMYASLANSYFNLETNKYEIDVAVQATTAGSSGYVSANKINRPLRTLSEFDSVTNKNKSSLVVDVESNSELLDRYKIAILGSQLGTVNGLKLYIKSKFQDSGDVLVITGGDQLITRDSESGAIDIIITGSQSVSRQDVKEFIGIGQLIVLDNQPVTNITNVAGYTLGVDYEFVKDTSGVSDSYRAKDGIRFLAGGSSPAIGSSINIQYDQNILIQNIQIDLENADNSVGGQDPLVRFGSQINVTIKAKLIILSGFSFTTINQNVISTIFNFINSLNLGDNVERSDIQAEVRKISGVDNFIFEILDKVGGSGLDDIIINKNEFARINTPDIVIIP